MANLDDVYEVDHRTAAFENHERGVLVCLAGPGTGKTYSLLARAATLGGRGVASDTICYLTFIREITNAFTDDYKEKFGAEAFETSAPRISTLHSFACRIARNQGFRIGYDGWLHFANAADKDEGGETFLSDLLRIVRRPGCQTVPQLRHLFDIIKQAWRDTLDPAGLPDLAPVILPSALALLRTFRFVDWDQTIPLAHSLLGTINPWPDWIRNIRHYFVDEYQDFNRAEQALIGLLAADAESVVIVGDDDQSLYSTRGGSPQGILALYASPQHDRVSLVKCHRCRTNILAPANAFLGKMKPNPRILNPVRPGGEVLCFRFKSSKAEVAFLVDWLAARVAEIPENPKPKDGVVCLFPTKRVLSCYFDLLSPHLPCVKHGTAVPAKRLWLERVMELLVEPRKRFVERLLLNQYEAIKPRHRAMIVDRVLERDIPPSLACESLLTDGAFNGKAREAAQAFCHACAAMAGRDVRQVATLIQSAVNAPEESVIPHLETLLALREPDRHDGIAPLCDAILPDTAPQPEDLRAVLCLTMHGAKGLTKKTVVVPGLEQAWLPGVAGPTELPERRRVFFVAVTRATDYLLLTFPHNRGRNESLNYEMPGRGEPSAFLADAQLTPLYHQ